MPDQTAASWAREVFSSLAAVFRSVTSDDSKESVPNNVSFRDNGVVVEDNQVASFVPWSDVKVIYTEVDRRGRKMLRVAFEKAPRLHLPDSHPAYESFVTAMEDKLALRVDWRTRMSSLENGEWAILYEKVGRVTASTDGFTLERMGSEAISALWKDVERVVAYKVDNVVYDTVVIEITTRDHGTITILDEDGGFDRFMSALVKHLDVDPGWYVAIIQPPFAENRMQLYPR